jgi:hypothetical protein
MKSQPTHRRHRTIAAVLAGLCLAAPASANAIPQGDTKYDTPSAGMSAAVTTPAPAASASPSSSAPLGDTKSDSPGASGAPQYQAPSIQVFRPERTIVRDVNQALPIVLSAAALLLALGGVGIVARRTRSLPRH